MHIYTSTTADGNLAFKYGERAEVDANRKRFFEKNNIDSSQVVSMQCEHGEAIVDIDRDLNGGLRETPISKVLGSPAPGRPDCLFEVFLTGNTIACEALVTNRKDVSLFLLTADCYPLVLYDTTLGVVALAHMGWKPTALHLAEKVVAHMQRVYGCEVRNITARFGPGISAHSYITPTPSQIHDAKWKGYISPAVGEPGMYHVDLLGFNIAALEAVGVPRGSIQALTIDTVTSLDYFSHYRSARTGEKEGRFATVVRL
jgi:copper oxidase (laccase) domain-containing protein